MDAGINSSGPDQFVRCSKSVSAVAQKRGNRVKARDLYRDVTPNWMKNHLRPLKRRAERAYIWLRVQGGHERLKPAFLIIGAEKAGTTSLFRYLARHPRVVEPLRKEILYFQAYSDRSLVWYFAHFPRRDSVAADAVTGEASPSYLFDPLVAERVARALPEAKVIALLRDPIARAISHYHHKVNKRVGESRELAECLVAEGMELQPELTARLIAKLGWRPDRVRSLTSNPPPSAYYIKRGFYADQLQNWFKFYNRDQILILRSEDLFEKPRETYARTLKFLDLDFFDLGPMRAYNTGSYGNVDPVIIRYLSDIYAAPNRRLNELIGIDFGWNAPKSKWPMPA
jgi:Sulfotransferase domain